MNCPKLHFNELESTNLYAIKNLSSLEDKTVIIADKQTKGRGRFDRTWVSNNSENAYFSIVLKNFPNQTPPLANITQYMSVILCELLQEYNVTAEIKWPNDVLVNEQKISGILSETSFQGSSLKGFVIGVGVNLNLTNEDLSKIDQPATALNLLTENFIDKEEFIERLTEKFFNEYDLFMKSGFEFIKTRYIQRCSFIGKEILIKNLETQKSGVAQEINDDGSLLLNNENNETETIIIGDMICLKTE